MIFTRAVRSWLLFSAPLLLMVVAVLTAFGWSESHVFAFYRHHRETHEGLRLFFELVTDWVNPLFYAFYAALLYRAWKSGDKRTLRFALIYAAVQLTVALVAVRLLKMSIGRPRPGEDPYPQGFTTRPSYHSLPSGHTTEVVGSAMALAMRWRAPALVLGLGCLAALVGFSRIYLGWHHPSDVLAGWMLGSVTGLTVTLLAPRPDGGKDEAGQ